MRTLFTDQGEMIRYDANNPILVPNAISTFIDQVRTEYLHQEDRNCEAILTEDTSYRLDNNYTKYFVTFKDAKHKDEYDKNPFLLYVRF